MHRNLTQKNLRKFLVQLVSRTSSLSVCRSHCVSNARNQLNPMTHCSICPSLYACNSQCQVQETENRKLFTFSGLTGTCRWACAVHSLSFVAQRLNHGLELSRLSAIGLAYHTLEMAMGNVNRLYTNDSYTSCMLYHSAVARPIASFTVDSARQVPALCTWTWWCSGYGVGLVINRSRVRLPDVRCSAGLAQYLDGWPSVGE